MDEATLFKFVKWMDYGKYHPRSKNFPSKGAWYGSRDRFWYKAMLFKFHKCIDYGQCHAMG